MDRVAPPSALLEVIDVALLRDSESASPGVYLAGAPYSRQTEFAEGPTVYVSTDDDSYEYLLTLPLAATMGRLVTELAFITSAGFDLASSAQVMISAGALSSITEELQLHGKNEALIGNEVLSFRTATLVQTDIYSISKLLRGMRGTEENVETHVADTRFVLLKRDTIVHVPLDASLLGSTLYFKAAYPGVDLADVLPVQHSLSLTSTNPPAVANTQAFRQASGDIKIKWERRTRLSHNPFLGIEAPVGQERRRYTVDIYTQAAPTVLVRTLDVEDAEEATYTAAQQTTDGTTGVALNLTTTQLGDRALSPAKTLALA